MELITGVLAVSPAVTPPPQVKAQAVTAGELEAGAGGEGELGGDHLLAALSVVTDHPL